MTVSHNGVRWRTEVIPNPIHRTERIREGEMSLGDGSLVVLVRTHAGFDSPRAEAVGRVAQELGLRVEEANLDNWFQILRTKTEPVGAVIFLTATYAGVIEGVRIAHPKIPIILVAPRELFGRFQGLTGITFVPCEDVFFKEDLLSAALKDVLKIPVAA